MRYRLKVSFRSDGRTYAPGAILPDRVPAGDLAYLKERGFVEPVDTGAPVADVSGQEVDGFPDTDTEDEGMGISFPDLSGEGQGDMKTPEEIQKIRTKDEIHSYALSIGLDLGDGYREESLKDLQERVITFQGQMEVAG